MSATAITSVFNDAYIAEVYEAYRRDPASVDASWRQFFGMAESMAGLIQPNAGAGSNGALMNQGPTANPDLLRKTAAAAALVNGIREYGHLGVGIDPLGAEPQGARELTPEYYGISAADLAAVPAAALGFTDGRFATAADVVALLRNRYSGMLGLEYTHLSTDAEREWFRATLRAGQVTTPLTPDEKRAVLERLTEVDGLERFLGFAFQGKKRFSIEGTDALVPMLDEAIAQAARLGAREVAIGMAHRGRLNVLVHVLGKPYEALFAEFEGRHADPASDTETGDVKYHMGYAGRRRVGDPAGGGEVAVTLAPNPSHLEFVGAVIDGEARAKQRVEGAPWERDESRVLPIAVHGDAAFIGEGVVAETLNMYRLRGYRVGGTLHIITNNQVGFTTDPIDSRSTHYASDLAKGFDIPVVHVNGDDAEACLVAVRLATAYRAQFKKDFLIDLVGYRRWGHNETDEPAFTQPGLYDRIKAHPTPRQVWGARLVREGVASAEDVERVDRDARSRFQAAYDRMKQGAGFDQATPTGQPANDGASNGSGPHGPTPDGSGPHGWGAGRATAVPAERLVALQTELLAYPDGFQPHPKLAKILQRRGDALGEKGGIEWGQAEQLAFASLVTEGVSVRLTGQDAERGTFGHRNAVLHDPRDGRTYTPLAHLRERRAAFEVYNSPLTETAVMAFDYGFSVAAPDALTLWEGQYGDFVNVAQTIIDQFLVADRAKWGQDSGLVLLLPHGYEGGGPEHSSARLERFLQLAAEGNMTVAYPGTPAQYFHVLREQAHRTSRRPLILMQPKSLLRLPAAASRLAELSEGAWQPVVDHGPGTRGAPAEGGSRVDDGRDAGSVRRVVLCTAKTFYDLTQQAVPSAVAVVRVDQLYPFPSDALASVLARYPNAREVVWAQEEPQNMGAWTFVSTRLPGVLAGGPAGGRRLRYVGRPERASPAEGYEAAHKAEQARIVAEALAVPEGAVDADVVDSPVEVEAAGG